MAKFNQEIRRVTSPPPGAVPAASPAGGPSVVRVINSFTHLSAQANVAPSAPGLVPLNKTIRKILLLFMDQK